MILVARIGGKGGGESNLGNARKKTFFFQEGFPNVGVSRGSLDAIFRFDKSLNLTNNFS